MGKKKKEQNKNPILSWVLTAIAVISTIGGGAWYARGYLDDVRHSLEILQIMEENKSIQEALLNEIHELREKNIELEYERLKSDTIR